MKSIGERTNVSVTDLGAIEIENELKSPSHAIYQKRDADVEVLFVVGVGSAVAMPGQPVLLGCLWLRAAWQLLPKCLFLGGAGQAGPRTGPHWPGRSHTCATVHLLQRRSGRNV